LRCLPVTAKPHAGAYAGYVFAARQGARGGSEGIFTSFQRGFEQVFERVRERYHSLLQGLVFRRRIFIPSFLGLVLVRSSSCRSWAKTFSRRQTAGNSFFMSVALRECALRRLLGFSILSRARFAMKFRLCKLTTYWITLAALQCHEHAAPDHGTLGAGDGDILVTLKLDHRPTADYVRALRRNLPRLFPAATFYTLPADITTQILNFGLPRDRRTD